MGRPRGETPLSSQIITMELLLSKAKDRADTMQEELDECRSLIAEWKPYMYCSHGRLLTYQCDPCITKKVNALLLKQRLSSLVLAVEKLLADMQLRAQLRGDLDEDGIATLDCGHKVLYTLDRAIAASNATLTAAKETSE